MNAAEDNAPNAPKGLRGFWSSKSIIEKSSIVLMATVAGFMLIVWITQGGGGESGRSEAVQELRNAYDHCSDRHDVSRTIDRHVTAADASSARCIGQQLDMAPSDVDRIFSDAPGERRGTTGWGEYRAYWGYEDRWEVRFVAED